MVLLLVCLLVKLACVHSCMEENECESFHEAHFIDNVGARSSPGLATKIPNPAPPKFSNPVSRSGISYSKTSNILQQLYHHNI